jgi:hypothetical protein
MKNVIALEELAMFALSIVGCYYLPVQFTWWVWPMLFLLPDLGMIGYAISPEVGAITYNLLHHKLVAVVVFLIGYFTNNPQLMLAGLILFGHSSMDRMLGYGLKFPDNFKHTHLGWIGDTKQN